MDLRAVYERLQRAMGSRPWWRAEGPFEVMVGALLTQQTTWRNVEAALRALRREGLLSPERMAKAPMEVLERCVRPTGFYITKARRLRGMARRVLEHGGLDEFLNGTLEEIRARLMQLEGVGPETADSVLLYGLGMPVMVVDAYTRRILGRLGLELPGNYEEARRLIETGIPRDVRDHQAFHALMVELGKRYCRPRPLCEGCPLLRICHHGREVTARA